MIMVYLKLYFYWQNFISIAKSTHPTILGFRRIGQVRQGMNFMNDMKGRDTITNSGLMKLNETQRVSIHLFILILYSLIKL